MLSSEKHSCQEKCCNLMLAACYKAGMAASMEEIQRFFRLSILRSDHVFQNRCAVELGLFLPHDKLEELRLKLKKLVDLG